MIKINYAEKSEIDRALGYIEGVVDGDTEMDEDNRKRIAEAVGLIYSKLDEAEARSAET